MAYGDNPMVCERMRRGKKQTRQHRSIAALLGYTEWLQENSLLTVPKRLAISKRSEFGALVKHLAQDDPQSRAHGNQRFSWATMSKIAFLKKASLSGTAEIRRPQYSLEW